jgi:hypothetical protein
MASRGASLALALAAGCGGAGDGDDAPADAGAPQQLTITLRDRDGAAASNATLLAVRDGEGAWRQVEGQAGVYTSTVHGSYGVFIGCDDADPALDDTYTTDDTRFYFRHPDDGFEVELPGCRPHKVYVSGTIEGLGSEDNVGVGGVRYRSGDASYRAAVTPGPVELLVVDWLPALRVPRMLRHDLGVVDTDLVHDVSLDEAVGAASVPLDVRGAAAGDDLIIVGQLRTQAGPVGAWATSGRGGRPNSLAILPTSLRKHGDVIDATVRLTTFGNPRSMQGRPDPRRRCRRDRRAATTARHPGADHLVRHGRCLRLARDDAGA